MKSVSIVLLQVDCCIPDPNEVIVILLGLLRSLPEVGMERLWTGGLWVLSCTTC